MCHHHGHELNEDHSRIFKKRDGQIMFILFLWKKTRIIINFNVFDHAGKKNINHIHFGVHFHII